jgi:putative transposase
MALRYFAGEFRCTIIHRWVVYFSPLLLERLNRRKRSVTGRLHVDETYIKVVAGGFICAGPSTGSATPSSSGSVNSAIAGGQADSHQKRWHDGPSASSSMAARPTGRRSFPATRPTACRTARRENRGRSGFARASISRMYLTRAVLLRCPGSVLSGVLPRRAAETASRAVRSRLAGRPSRGMRGLALTERARRYRSPAAGWIGEADFAILSWLG